MNYGGAPFERTKGAGFPPGYSSAHVPTLSLTTHGLGMEGARQAAAELARLWLAEKAANHERVPAPSETYSPPSTNPPPILPGTTARNRRRDE
jgi:hypothetical protein